MTTSYGQLQAGSGFYAVGKDMLRAFGVTKAMFIAVLADIDDYSTLQGNERFFATREILKQKTGYAEMTIKKLLKELKSEGILDDGLKGEGLDNRKFYKIDYERLGEIVKNTLNEPICVRAKNSPNQRAKNSPNQRAKNSPDDRAKNSPNLHITTNLNLQEQNLQLGEQKSKTQKMDFKKSQFLSAEECLDFVKESYEKLETKPKGDFNVFCEWLVRKADKKGLLPYVLKRDFENYQKLDFLTKESPNDRLNRALQGNARGVYQSLVFENDAFMAGGYKPQGLQHNSHNVNENFKITDGQKELFENTSKRAMVSKNVKIHKSTIKGFKEVENERQATE